MQDHLSRWLVTATAADGDPALGGRPTGEGPPGQQQVGRDGQADGTLEGEVHLRVADGAAPAPAENAFSRSGPSSVRTATPVSSTSTRTPVATG
jgi:hypothetical protein